MAQVPKTLSASIKTVGASSVDHVLQKAISPTSERLRIRSTADSLPIHEFHCKPFSMAASKLPPIEAIPQLSTDDRAALLDALFEPCTQLHTLSLGFLREKTFSSYDEMIIGIGMQLTELAESTSTSDKEWLNKILGAHPRLGEKKIDSAQSRAEQAQLQSGRSEEAEQLMALNAEYERMFPGLRYV